MNYSHIKHYREGTEDADAIEVFRCTDCGATTRHSKGWSGEPDRHQCSGRCQEKHGGDWRPGKVSRNYRNNYDRIVWEKN